MWIACTGGSGSGAGPFNEGFDSQGSLLLEVFLVLGAVTGEGAGSSNFSGALMSFLRKLRFLFFVPGEGDWPFCNGKAR